MGEVLPGLLAEAYVTLRQRQSVGEDELAATRALVSRPHLHQVFLRGVGERKLSLRAADHAMQIAGQSGGPALIAAAAWNVCGILTSSGEVADSLARETLAHCRPWPGAPGHLSAYGALRLAGVIAAVRDSRAPAAWDLVRGADAVAGRLGVDRNDFHTSFGPTNRPYARRAPGPAEEGDIAEALRAR